MPLLKKPLLRRLSVATALAVAASTAVLSPATADEPARTDRAAAVMGWPPAPPAQLVIDTAGAVIDREDYVAGTVTLDGVTRVTEVRGRGNSTWGWAKKPYKLKLEEDAALVGSREYDEWVLLAGYGDRSALRTAAAFAIAAQTRLQWTPRFRFVEVVLNGQSQGLYLLTEQVEEGKGRVDLPDDGYLLEINQRYLRDDEPGFRTRAGRPWRSRTPTRSRSGSGARYGARCRGSRRSSTAPTSPIPTPATRRTSTCASSSTGTSSRSCSPTRTPTSSRACTSAGCPASASSSVPSGTSTSARAPVAGVLRARDAGTPASDATGSPGCWRTPPSPRGSRAGGPGSSRPCARSSPRSRPRRRRWPRTAEADWAQWHAVGRPGVDPPRP